jgi:hypothetical protein
VSPPASEYRLNGDTGVIVPLLSHRMVELSRRRKSRGCQPPDGLPFKTPRIRGLTPPASFAISFYGTTSPAHDVKRETNAVGDIDSE